MFSAKHLVDWFPAGMLDCPETSGGTSACLGASAIVRMSFSLFCIHLLVFLLILARNSTVAAFHDGCWGTKFLLTLALFIGSMWISNDFMKGYMVMTRVVSTFFLVYQAMLMLIVGYKVNDTLVRNYEQDTSNCSGIILMLVTIVLTVINAWWMIAQYISFGCAGNEIIMTVTAIGVVAMYGLVFLRLRKDSSILTSSIAALYCLYLQWTALSSDQDPECNPNLGEASNTIYQIGCGLAFTAVSLTVVSASSKSDDENSIPAGLGEHLMENKNEINETEDIERKDGQRDQDAHVFAISNATIVFQALMMLSAMYLSMLCTNWGNVTIFDDTTDFF